MFPALLPTLPPSVPQATVLRYKFHLGDTHRSELLSDVDMEMTVSKGGKPISNRRLMDTISKTTVKSVMPDGTAVVQSVVVKQDVTVGGKKTPSTQTVGATTLFKSTPTGDVTIIKSPQTSMKELNSALGSLHTGSILPNGPVKVGSRWTSTISMGGTGAVSLNNSVQKIASGIVYLRGTGTVDAGKLLPALFKGRMAGVKASGTAKYEMISEFDVAKGSMRKTTSRVNMSADLDSLNPQTGKPVHMHLDLLQNITQKHLD